MSTAIDIRQVSKSFGSLQALNGVSLSIEKGEFFGLLGPNGAGKSTLINILAGLTLADSGTVSIMGHDVVSRYRQARHSLGIVPQELVFDAFFTVREVLQLQAGYFGLRHNQAWIDELLEALMLTDKADANMRSLSGGMKRRVLVAQALVHKPDVVVLDEPTAGVDVELRKSLWEFISRLHENGHTIVLTTHYLEEAETLCERIAILNQGQVIALDSKQGLLDSELGQRCSLSVTLGGEFTDLPPSLRDRVRRIDGNTIELEWHKGRDAIADIIIELNRHGLQIVDMQTNRADLEDVFVELIQRHVS